jgi:predicted phage terminase large subunit-like protein
MHNISPAGLAVKASRGRWKYHRHLQILDQAIVECVHQYDGRLIVEMPPRHGKSETVSHYTPPWFLGCFPDKRVGLASYEHDFASLWGRKSRDVLQEWGPELYGVTVSDDSSAVDRWDVVAWDGYRYVPTGGGMIVSGVGGPLTGRGFDLGIIDDPIKNSKEAMSPTIRANIWDWWQSTFSTRFEPGASCVVMMTRWHQDDLIGRILKEMLEDEEQIEWKILSFPALYMPDFSDYDIKGQIADVRPELLIKDFRDRTGQALWPWRFDEKSLDKRRRTSGSFWWSAMFQQDPQPARDIGTFQPDWTAGALMSVTADDTIVEDVKRFQESPGVVERNILKQAERDGRDVAIRMEEEPGASGKTVIDHYRRLLDGYDFRGVRSTGNKEIRANPVAAKAEAGHVKIVRGPWNKMFLDEAELFPYGENDDMVDAVSGGFEYLATSNPADIVPWGASRTSPWTHVGV